MTLNNHYTSYYDYDYEIIDGEVTVYTHFRNIDNVYEVLDDSDYEDVGIEIVDILYNDWRQFIDTDCELTATVDISSKLKHHFAITFSQTLTQAVEASEENGSIVDNISEGFRWVYGTGLAEDDE